MKINCAWSCILEEQDTYLLRAFLIIRFPVVRWFLVLNIPTKSQQQGMSSSRVTTSGSQKKIWISWKDKIEGTDRQKEKRKPVQTKLRMISFFPILVGLQHKPLSGADTVGSLPKLNLKLKYIIINIIGDYKGSLINLNWRK